MGYPNERRRPMNMNRRGGAMTAIVAGVAFLVCAGVVWYFVSDPFHTKVNGQFNQMTKWTPEQIAKDPVNYLNFCEEQTKKAIEQLKADRISVAQNKGLLEEMRDKAANKVRVGEQKLAELKGAYEKGEKDTSWPVSFEGQSREKDWVRTNVMSLYKQVETQKH